MEKEPSIRKRRESDSRPEKEVSKELHHHHHRSKRDDHRHRRRSDATTEMERSRDRDLRRDRERSHSIERNKKKDRGDSEERDRDAYRERSHSVERKKRKERSESEERSEKRNRVYEDNGRDRRRFEDIRAEEDGKYGEGLRPGGEFASKEAKHEPGNGVATGQILAPSNASYQNFEAHIDSPTTKVSSISKTNENKGVNSNRSHKVPGKSSRDGTTSDVSKSGGVSRDILAKAKLAIQKQMELRERMKKIPSLNRDVDLTAKGRSQMGDVGVTNASSSGRFTSFYWAHSSEC